MRRSLRSATFGGLFRQIEMDPHFMSPFQLKRYVVIVLFRVVGEPVHRDACVKRARHRKRAFIESNMRVVLSVAFVERTSGCADHHVVCGAGLRDAAV